MQVNPVSPLDSGDYSLQLQVQDGIRGTESPVTVVPFSIVDQCSETVQITTDFDLAKDGQLIYELETSATYNVTFSKKR